MSKVVSLATRRAASAVIPTDPMIPDERVDPRAFEAFEAVRIAMAAAMLHPADAATMARMAIAAIEEHATVAPLAR